jgi:REP element-mobilizing transposase RayT
MGSIKTSHTGHCTDAQSGRLYKNRYRIESARLKGWDYSSPGYYFIIICTKNMECLFGKITGGKIILSEMGKIAEQYWREIPVHFNDIILDEFVVMPNHIHGILSIVPTPKPIVETPNLGVSTMGLGVTTIPGVSTITGVPTEHDKNIKKPANIGIVINQYKRICTIRIRTSNPGISIWQPRFHDHIIRDENELNRIRQYIIDNPVNWRKDDNYITEVIP